MLRYLFLAVIALYLTAILFPQLNINLIISILCMTIVASTLFFVKRFVRVFGLIFLTLGIIMLVNSEAGVKEYIISFGPMLNLLSLFALIPILALPIKLGHYADGIQNAIRQKVKTSGQLYMMTSGISYFLSCFMNLATLPMTYYSIKPSVGLFPLKNKERFMSRAVTHGFAMPLLWAPVTPIVGIVIEMTGVSWGAMLPYLIPLSVLGLCIDWIMGVVISARRPDRYNKAFAGNETAAALDTHENKGSYSKLLHILGAIFLFNVTISFIEKQFQLSFLVLVTLLVIPFAFLWCLFLGESKGFALGLKEHFQTHLFKMKDQFFIFLSAGFFISAVNYSKTDQLFNGWITSIKDFIGIEIFIVILPLVPLALAFTGLHPAVGLALMAEALDPASLNIAPEILTVSMLGGAVSALLMGPYNATIGLMANIVKDNPFKVSNWNAPFTFTYIGLLMVFLVVLQIINL
ncbi:hypothetical protein [Bacillus taeanensis]|uniref:Citrate transporter-like domain-containing protein n=1 Tax=Bacillus taeanensis TaxID=273032 RepID=A0A366Y454_9BACI|nr:hypothetical protein [Bacillus taeanensis]RBW70971.1 hypothetical protein DS031_02960 [Bacillus taeanensis]